MTQIYLWFKQGDELLNFKVRFSSVFSREIVLSTVWSVNVFLKVSSGENDVWLGVSNQIFKLFEVGKCKQLIPFKS